MTAAAAKYAKAWKVLRDAEGAWRVVEERIYIPGLRRERLWLRPAYSTRGHARAARNAILWGATKPDYGGEVETAPRRAYSEAAPEQ